MYFMAIWNILHTFGIFYEHLVHFFRFWYLVPRKIWQPWFRRGRKIRKISIRGKKPFFVVYLCLHLFGVFRAAGEGALQPEEY
jgi:hypothetical protein